MLGRSATITFVLLMTSACQRPFGSADPAPPLRTIVEQAIQQELSAAADASLTEATSRGEGHDDVLTRLAPRRDELDALSPAPPSQNVHSDVGLDLSGQPSDVIELSSQAAVESAINRNLAVQAARLQPQITAEELRAAQAIFDAVLFANVDMNWADQPQRVPVIMGIPIGTSVSRTQNYRFETGVRQPLATGGQVFVSTDLTRFKNLASGIDFTPDPAYTGAVRVGANQPLLRGFGDDYATATIQLARTAQERSVFQWQADLMDIVRQTEDAYWNLDAAWTRLAIAQWLVDAGIEVREIMARRQEFDARPAQYSDAVARVEQRQADVIRARRNVRIASDALKLLINDPQLPISSEVVLRPIDAPLDALELSILVSLRESIISGIEHRPELRQSALDIQDATIRQRLSDSDRLPLLNLSAQAAFYGLDDTPGGAYREANRGDFIDYLLGLAFEWPIGSRAAEAEFRAARLRRSSAILNYQRTVQQVVLEVKNAIRDAVTNLELINATRSFRIAQAENLRTLLIEEELLAGLTPEFLNLKFTRQETLAQARQQEVQALADFNRSLAALYRAMGTSLRMRRIDVQVEPHAP